MSRMTNKVIKQYARIPDKNQEYSRGNPIGVVMVRANEDGTYSMGWSQCSRNDRFDRKKGTMIAMGRLAHAPVVFDVRKNARSVARVNDSLRPEMLEAVASTLLQAINKNK